MERIKGPPGRIAAFSAISSTHSRGEPSGDQSSSLTREQRLEKQLAERLNAQLAQIREQMGSLKRSRNHDTEGVGMALDLRV